MSQLKALKRAVHAVHKNLGSAIEQMDPIILLRYCSPDDRPFHAAQLNKAGIITKEEAREFSKFVGGRPVG